MKHRAHWHLEICTGLWSSRNSRFRQVLGEDTFTAPVEDWARLAPAMASLR